MWLYVPSVPSQDMADLNLDSPVWQTLSQSATSKETWRKPVSWYRAFKKDSYLTRLSGVMSKVSNVNRGVARWISSLPVSHANHIALRERNLGKTTNAISGPKLYDSQGNSGIQLSFARTFREFSVTTMTSSSQNYKAWATALRKDSTQRQKQAHRIEGKDYSFWPTVQPIGAGRNDVLADASDTRPQGVRLTGQEERPSRPRNVPLYPPGPADRDGWAYVFDQMPSLKPTFCRMVDGVADRMDGGRRLRSIGNGVVPAVVALAWCDLNEKIKGVN